MLEEQEVSLVRPDTNSGTTGSGTTQAGQTLSQPATRLLRIIFIPSVRHKNCDGMEINPATGLVKPGQLWPRLHHLSLSPIPSQAVQSLDPIIGSWEGSLGVSHPKGSVKGSNHPVPSHAPRHDLY